MGGEREVGERGKQKRVTGGRETKHAVFNFRTRGGRPWPVQWNSGIPQDSESHCQRGLQYMYL